EAAAGKQQVEDNVKTLLDSSVSKYLADRVPARELGKYGLDKPTLEILLTDGGKHVLQVGKEEKSGSYYAREKGDERVFVLSSFPIDAFRNKKAEDFRDKALLAIADTEKVKRVTIEGTKGPVEVVKQGTDWQLTRPQAAKADTIEVNSLVSQAKDM